MRTGAGSLSRYRVRAAIVGASLALAACHSASTLDPQRIIANAGEYDFPLANPYVATVAGTPSALAADVPEDVPVRHLDLTIIEDRKTPEIFWYEDRFRYSVAAQRGEAPLIFIIAGTNAGYASRYSRFSAELVFQRRLPRCFAVVADLSQLHGRRVDHQRARPGQPRRG